MEIKITLNIDANEDGKVSVSIDTDTKKDVSEKDVSKKIKLVNRNAKTIKEAYGLTDEELAELVRKIKKFDKNDLDSIDNCYDQIIPLVYLLNNREFEYAIKTVELLSNIKVKNKIGLIEAIYNAGKKRGRFYVKALLEILHSGLDAFVTVCKVIFQVWLPH